MTEPQLELTLKIRETFMFTTQMKSQAGLYHPIRENYEKNGQNIRKMILKKLDIWQQDNNL